MLTIRKNNIDTYYEANEYLIIYFFAQWVGPCQGFNPMFDAANIRYNTEGISFGKSNIDQEKRLARQLKINTLPTVCIFKKGEELSRLKGIPKNKTEFFTFLDTYIK